MKKVLFGVLGFIGGLVGTLFVASFLFGSADTGGLVTLLALAGAGAGAWAAATGHRRGVKTLLGMLGFIVGFLVMWLVVPGLPPALSLLVTLAGAAGCAWLAATKIVPQRGEDAANAPSA